MKLKKKQCNVIRSSCETYDTNYYILFKYCFCYKLDLIISIFHCFILPYSMECISKKIFFK